MLRSWLNDKIICFNEKLRFYDVFPLIPPTHAPVTAVIPIEKATSNVNNSVVIAVCNAILKKPYDNAKNKPKNAPALAPVATVEICAQRL